MADTRAVLLAFIEDGSLEILEGIEDARRRYAGRDVQSGVVRFYDERGNYLGPRLRGPAFDLEPDPGAGEDPIRLALYETAVLRPNRWFATIEALKAALRAQGADVDGPLPA